MTLRSALVALAALALVGCAPSFLGEWGLASAVTEGGATIPSAVAVFAPESVSVTAEVIASCGSARVGGRATWFVNANGEVVVRSFTCEQRYPCASDANVDLCGALDSLRGAHRVEDHQLSIIDNGVARTRWRRR